MNQQQRYAEAKKTVDATIADLLEAITEHGKDFERKPDKELVRDLDHLQGSLEALVERFNCGRYGYTLDSVCQEVDGVVDEDGDGTELGAKFEQYTGRQQAFVRDLLVTELGETLFHYEGRFFASGPAVRAADMDQVQEAIRATNAKVRLDNLGLGFVVYCG